MLSFGWRIQRGYNARSVVFLEWFLRKDCRSNEMLYAFDRAARNVSVCKSHVCGRRVQAMSSSSRVAMVHFSDEGSPPAQITRRLRIKDRSVRTAAHYKQRRRQTPSFDSKNRPTSDRQYTWHPQDNQKDDAEERRGQPEKNCFRLKYHTLKRSGHRKTKARASKSSTLSWTYQQ